MLYGNFWDVKNGELIINEFLLTVPVMKAVIDKYKDPMPALKFLRHRFDLESPYADSPEEEKEEILLKDFPGEYTLEDLEMINAIEYLDGKISPAERYFINSKRLLERMGTYAATQSITAGRDGNIASLQRILATVGKTTTEFKQLEKIVEQELKDKKTSKNRGEKMSSYDD